MMLNGESTQPEWETITSPLRCYMITLSYQYASHSLITLTGSIILSRNNSWLYYVLHHTSFIYASLFLFHIDMLFSVITLDRIYLATFWLFLCKFDPDHLSSIEKNAPLKTQDGWEQIGDYQVGSFSIQFTFLDYIFHRFLVFFSK